MKYHALLLFLKNRQNLKLSSAANYRWRFKGFGLFLVILVFFGPLVTMHGIHSRSFQNHLLLLSNTL